MGNKKHITIALIGGLALVAGVAALFYTGFFAPGSLKSGSFETVVAHRGEVLSSTLATGVVEISRIKSLVVFK